MTENKETLKRQDNKIYYAFIDFHTMQQGMSVVLLKIRGVEKSLDCRLVGALHVSVGTNSSWCVSPQGTYVRTIWISKSQFPIPCDWSVIVWLVRLSFFRIFRIRACLVELPYCVYDVFIKRHFWVGILVPLEKYRFKVVGKNVAEPTP